MGMLRAHIATAVAAAPAVLVSAAVGQQMTFTEASTQTGLTAVHVSPVQIPYQYDIAGGSVGDFNNDGWQDLFVMGGGINPDLLYINNQDGTFTESAAAWGLDAMHYGVSATTADFNGDGWLDLSVSSMGPSDGPPSAGQNRLYRNNGDGTFTDVAQAAGVAWRVAAVDSFATAFGDYDGDGDLDMFSTSYAGATQGNRLWRNNLREDGSETFTDITGPSGLDALIDNSVSGFVPGFADINHDGHLDILLVADHGSSMLLLGQGDGTFADATPSVPRLSQANGMGLAIGDVNRDGLLDWYISSIHWSFLQTSGNMLFVQRPGGGFDEVGRAAGVNECGWGWGVVISDLDHDGLEEIVATKNADGTAGHVLKNANGSQFDDISIACGFEHHGGGRGLVNFDYDNDGDQDVVVFRHNGPLGVWRNDLSGPGTNWLRVSLDTSARPTLAPDGFHSVVRVSAGGERHMQIIDGATNHCSSGELGAHFGLGAHETLDWVRIEWRDGTATILTGVPANQILSISAPAHPGDLNLDGLPDLGDVVHFASGFMSGSAGSDLDGNGLLDLADVVLFVTWFNS